jgi:hypothetical protein
MFQWDRLHREDNILVKVSRQSILTHDQIAPFGQLFVSIDMGHTIALTCFYSANSGVDLHYSCFQRFIVAVHIIAIHERMVSSSWNIATCLAGW